MDRATELDVVRRAFAKQVLAEVQVGNPRLEAAFATVRREDFLGPGPWVIPRWLDGWVATPDDDPVHLYIDSVVQIIAERHLNNGQPSGHAKWIDSAAIREGDHVVHVGTGTGYYTAIVAHLVGPSGKVTGIEADPGLAERAQANLASLANVRVLQGDGATVPFDAADVIYVNAGTTRPARGLARRVGRGRAAHIAADERQGLLGERPTRVARAARRLLPYRAPGLGVSGAVDHAAGDHSVRELSRPGVGGRACRRIRERRLGAGDAPLPPQPGACGSRVAQRAGLVPGIRVISSCMCFS